VKALVFGASGGLASSIAKQYLRRGDEVGLVTRATRMKQVTARFATPVAAGRASLLTIQESYASFSATQPYNAYFFTQALFNPTPLVGMTGERIEDEITVGLTDPIQLTRSLLLAHPPAANERRDFCFIGSTSSYAGFKNTTVYCAIKHGLVGFVRAMNDEYAATQTRFWLFSMGSMDTEMGANVPEQDRISFLQPDDVAQRIVDAVTHPSNMFEPEVLIRRRSIVRSTT
jgi:NAD(P)-dependent dehydrogenase (short-subunit alcohol dehydrogenase family)